MQISLLNSSPNFKALEKTNPYLLKNIIAAQRSETQAVISNASKELSNIKTKLVIDFVDNFLIHYVDMGKEALSYIDKAACDKNILQVYGYIFDKNSNLKNTEYVCCDIPLKNKKQAELFANLINHTGYSDYFSDRLAKAVIVAKAVDEIV